MFVGEAGAVEAERGGEGLRRAEGQAGAGRSPVPLRGSSEETTSGSLYLGPVFRIRIQSGQGCSLF